MARKLSNRFWRGRNGVWLAEQGLDVLSVDLSPTALGMAAQIALVARK